MFIRPRKPAPKPHVRPTLRELGYEFDMADGKLRNIATSAPYEYDTFGTNKKKNTELYQSLVAPASRDVYRIMLEGDLHMETIAVPDSSQPHCNIYATPEALSKERLVVIITGNGTFGGVWASNVLLKEGLRAGSVLEYVRACMCLGYGVLVLNPNENTVAPDGHPETFSSYFGHYTPIYGSETPDEHVGYVWSQIIRNSAAKSVAFIAYNTSGLPAVDLLKHDFERFVAKTTSIAFIDSIHSTFRLDLCVLQWLKLAARQWETSAEPADCQIANDRVGCVAVSSGNSTDCRELTPLTCMQSVLDFIFDGFERGPIDNATFLATEVAPTPYACNNAPAEIASEADSSSSYTDVVADELDALDSIQVISSEENPSNDGYIGWEM
ncbi:hypothetical protein H4R26_003310 [Coemansia thaxteri]|uniref:Arb2 domain-containing protein n=1 Tax=Coemansia thaxteri TaxID=2663907 RepID=A0A9W8BCV7_9FUNG|nr:hypothetical protein H4R26_003310 [Coemansia thaxteri]KAJ2483970.1 hypothetical protein EV174_002818 [Coemansia sp. RSA 2320]